MAQPRTPRGLYLAHCPFGAMASEEGGVATETPLPELEVNFNNLDGFVCSVIATAMLTVWELKSLLKRRLQIPKREMMLAFGSEVLSLPSERLGSAFGVMEGTVDVTLVRTPSICHCGALGAKRCAGCSTHYCGRRCQRLDWSRHRLQCSAASALWTRAQIVSSCLCAPRWQRETMRAE